MKFNVSLFFFVTGITVPTGTKFSVSLATNKFYEALFAALGDDSYDYLNL